MAPSSRHPFHLFRRRRFNNEHKKKPVAVITTSTSTRTPPSSSSKEKRRDRWGVPGGFFFWSLWIFFCCQVMEHFCAGIVDRGQRWCWSMARTNGEIRSRTQTRFPYWKMLIENIFLDFFSLKKKEKRVPPPLTSFIQKDHVTIFGIKKREISSRKM